MKEKQGLVQVIAAVVLVMVIALIVWAVLPRSQPTIEMDATMNPTDFNTSEQSILTVNLKSNDPTNAHTVELRFVTYSLVRMYVGATPLAQETPNTGNYTFSLILQPAEKIEQPFVVKVSGLPTGIASQELSLRVEAYSDGRLVTIHESIFKVEEA